MITLSSLDGRAQSMSIDKDYVTWKTSSRRNTVTDVKELASDVFRSSPDSIYWTLNRKTYQMHIDSKHDTWPELLEDGAVTYDVLWNGIPGTIFFEKSNGTTRIVTNFFKGSVNAAPFEYAVSQLVKD